MKVDVSALKLSPDVESKLTDSAKSQLLAQQQMNEQSNAQSHALLMMQKQENQRSEAIAAVSNMMKNAHDSAMLVINNAKG